VFLAFTLSQAGMVVHWMRLRGRGWQIKAFINGIGAVTTAITFVVVAVSKFLEGAWIIAVLVPILMFIFHKIHEHYREIGPQLSLHGTPFPPTPPSRPRTVIPISGIHRGTLAAVQFACSISDDVTAVYIDIDPDETQRFREAWEKWGAGIQLTIVPSPYRAVLMPLLNFLDQTDQEHGDGQAAVLILPEFVPGAWWEHFLHNQTAFMLKLALLYQRKWHGSGRVVVDVPFYLET
jgi:hypothetical protein